MPKKEKIAPASKHEKADKILQGEIDKIIRVTEEQNMAIRKILKSNSNILKQREKVWKNLQLSFS